MLLDCCAVPDAPVSGTNGVKQAIAAFARETAGQDPGSHSFTYHLIDALHKLSAGPPFTAQQLHEELIVSLRHYRSLDQNGLTNGASKSNELLERTPVFFSLTPSTPQNILLTPIPPNAQIASPLGVIDPDINGRFSQGEQLFQDPSNPGLLFEEQRVLVSIPFHGEPDHEMASLQHWLNSIPATTAKVTVEGRFQGPPTVMLISMPTDTYNAIAHDRQCIFLGYIKSHNMVKEHQNLIDLAMLANQASSKHLEDGKILLEAADALAAAQSPGVARHEAQPLAPPNIVYLAQQSPHSLPLPPPPAPSSMPAAPEQIAVPEHKDHVEDSDEMHEAAIQLKALSHVRPVSHDSQRQERSASHIPPEGSNSPHFQSPRQGSISSQDGADSGLEDNVYSSEYNSPASRPKARRSIQKAGPKQDTRCSMCSHAPFKDSSSLRKHVAAAHTRPFPCAFAFAGCSSTFGSKNEWKRHIASQHLCLSYYRCSSCPQSTAEGKGNEFNRKDLFTQHLRRMHAPFAIKKAIAKGDSKLQVEWETHVKEMQASCLVVRRSPPQQSACPKAGCSNVFEGAGSWDDWTEHVGRHMEKGEAGRLGVDRLLARWALEEGIIERREGGEYRLCGGERGEGGAGYFSDGNGAGVSVSAGNGNGTAAGMMAEAEAAKGEVERMEEAVMMADEALR